MKTGFTPVVVRKKKVPSITRTLTLLYLSDKLLIWILAASDSLHVFLLARFYCKTENYLEDFNLNVSNSILFSNFYRGISPYCLLFLWFFLIFFILEKSIA